MNGTHPNGILTLPVPSGATVGKGDVIALDGSGAITAANSGAIVGVALDAADAGSLVPVALFGAYPGTVLAKASSGVTGAPGNFLLTDGSVVDSAPNSTGGTVIGVVVAPADENGLVEIAPVVPLHYAG